MSIGSKIALIVHLISAGFLAAETNVNRDQIKSGVSMKVETKVAQDLILTKRIAIGVSENESPTALLAPGQFSSTWTGVISIEKRSRIYFSFEGTGSAELFINGESVLKEDSNLGAEESARLRLNSGLVPIEVKYTSLDSGEGHFRLMWRGRDFAKEPLPAALLKYENNASIDKAILIRQGRALFAELKCAKCHQGGTGMPEITEMAPSLKGVGSRLKQEWISQWLKDPKSMRSHARMPKSLTDSSESKHIAAYLKTLTDTPIKVSAGDAVSGAKKFHDLGCIACHISDPKQDLGKWKQAPIELFNAGHKYAEGALVAFLKQPNKYHNSTRMPDFGLSDNEASDLAAFIRTLAKKAANILEKGDIARGKMLVATQQCSQCHDGVEGTDQNYPPLAHLSSTDASSQNCMDDHGKVVSYGLNIDEKRSISAFLNDKKAVNSLAYYNKREYAERQFTNLNCAACHQHDDTVSGLSQTHSLSAAYSDILYKAPGKGMSPPDLTFIGEKIRSEWMHKLFSGGLDKPTRPWLKQRMPAYPSRAYHLADGFAAQYGVVDETVTATPIEEPGKKLFGMDGGFGCAACHGAADAKPIAVFEAAGVNLQFSGARLREDYYHRWMQDPQRIDPHTIMPKYFVDDNTTTLSEPLGGDGRKQMDAIWNWMQKLNTK